MDSELFSKANVAFVEENYEEALQLYTQAIDVDSSKDDYFVARAHAQIKLDRYSEAAVDADAAVKLNPSNAKAFLRKGVACFHQGQYDMALTAFKTGQELQSSEKNLPTWIQKCEAKLDLAKAALRDISQVPCGASIGTSNSNSQGDSSVSSKPETQVQEEKPAAVPMPTGQKTRYDWYQTETHVILTILIKNVKKEDMKLDIQEHSLSCSIPLPSGSDYSLELDLAHSIVPSQCITKALASKVEIKLKKAEGIRWTKLEGDGTQAATQIKQFEPSVTKSAVPKYPSSSQHTRDWDKLASELSQEEKDEKLEGDAALNKLFQQIYADGSDEVKRAMNKSFMESGGTVLSTNWKEIGSKETEVKPPDGMEHKKYQL